MSVHILDLLDQFKEPFLVHFKIAIALFISVFSVPMEDTRPSMNVLELKLCKLRLFTQQFLLINRRFLVAILKYPKQ